MLQEILPLTLSPVRGEVPAAAVRGSGFWKRPTPPPPSGRLQRPIVAIKELRLPEGLSRIGCDTGQVMHCLAAILTDTSLDLHLYMRLQSWASAIPIV